MDWETHTHFSLQVMSDGSHVLIALHGELDIAAEPQLAAELASIVASRPAAVTVDLRKLTFLDSTGLRALLTLREECERLGCGLVLVRGDTAVQRTFDVSGVAPHFVFVGRLDPPVALQATG